MSALAVINGLLVVSLITVAFFKSLDLSSAENKVYILLERMKIREINQKICDDIVNNVLLQLSIKFKEKKLLEELKLLNIDTSNNNEAEKKKIEKKKRNLKNKKDSLDLNMKHLIAEKNKNKKIIDNINTSGYIMESIIDDISSITTEIEDLGLSINNIIRDLISNVRKDDIIISTIKKKLKSESEKKMNLKVRAKKNDN
jgi:hypothetical protein